MVAMVICIASSAFYQNFKPLVFYIIPPRERLFFDRFLIEYRFYKSLERLLYSGNALRFTF